MTPDEITAITDRFFDRTLPKPEWTHEAHLLVGWVSLDSTLADGVVVATALDRLRVAIKAYNDVTGVANTADSGYHETLTRYYLEAVQACRSGAVDEMLASPLCSRDAPEQFWSRELLFSRKARAEWTEPDLGQFPWRAERAARC